MAEDVRSALDALIRDSGEDYSAISRLLGRNPAYIQQFIKRGTPRRLAEEDRLKLAAYFRVSEDRLGGRSAPAGGMTGPSPSLVTISRIAIGASAGPGGIAEIEERDRPIAFDEAFLRDLGVGRRAALSIIRVAGDSMEPTLHDGDDILVDRDSIAIRSGSIYVLRLDDLLVVKRLVRDDRGLVIHSDNPAHPANSSFDPATLHVIGRVLWCGRKL
ncbi:MAG: S24 family peptidase [Pseudomonadota bacterium]